VDPEILANPIEYKAPSREVSVSVTDPRAGPAPGAAGARERRSLEPGERRAVAALALIYGIRMLGLFLMLPVLFLYGRALPGATPALAGFAVGVFALVQALLQVPFGAASDRIGRRPVIAVGLAVFAAGSLWAATAGSIGALIAARTLQGAGAVAGPITALLADLTRSEVRTRAMALIGISIGGSFVVGLIAAPPLSATIGVPGLFVAIAVLAVLAIALLYAVVPLPAAATAAGRTGRLGDAFAPVLVPHYLGIFVLNGVLTATFVGAQTALHDRLGIALADHWRTYLVVFLLSIPPTVPLVLASERSRRPGRIVQLGIGLLALALGAAAAATASYLAFAAALVLFFTAFNYLEARLPARLSQTAPLEVRGAALSVFATAQSLGSFTGSVAAGALAGSRLGVAAVFATAAVATAAWWAAYRPERD